MIAQTPCKEMLPETVSSMLTGKNLMPIQTSFFIAGSRIVEAEAETVSVIMSDRTRHVNRKKIIFPLDDH